MVLCTHQRVKSKWDWNQTYYRWNAGNAHAPADIKPSVAEAGKIPVNHVIVEQEANRLQALVVHSVIDPFGPEYTAYDTAGFAWIPYTVCTSAQNSFSNPSSVL